MIDALSVFTRGGIVLWSYYFIKLTGNPLETLIKSFLLEERSGECSCMVNSYRLRWKMANEFDFIFVVVYEGIQQLLYIDSILDHVKNLVINNINLYCSKYNKNSNNYKYHLKQILFGKQRINIEEKQLFHILNKCENLLKINNRPNVMRTFEQSRKGKKGIVKKKSNDNNSNLLNEDEDEDEDEEDPEKDNNNKLLLESKRNILKKENVFANFKNLSHLNGRDVETSKKSKKMARSWFDQKITQKRMDELDFSKKKEKNENEVIKDIYNSDKKSESFSDIQSEVDVSDIEEKALKGGKSTIFGKLTSAIQNVMGNKVITEEDLEDLMKDFKTMLMTKNVAEEISEMITQSVKRSVLGNKTQRFTTVRNSVKNALAESIQNILLPNKIIDLAGLALQSQSMNRVFSIVFLGINGVGKSTSLAKVAYYLKKRGLNVMIAACDTFRAGAVEQLRTHAKCLDVHLFERGYGKDAALIAREALTYAKNEGYDVVLIDTAGRMQDNEPLMRALGKLINYNNPDLILFVGEALVGNDAVDQLKKFNQKLIDMSDITNQRCIDGMLLTKFDTVDDKVGAALSMTYITGKPIVFVGTGQKYGHLSKLHVNTVVKALLS